MASKDNKNVVLNLSDPQRETAEKTYERLKSEREPYIKRAEDCAAMTIPALFPKESDTSSTEYKLPNQAVGARGVNNLSSKLLLALLPPNSPFFRLTLDNQTQKEILENNDTELQQQMEQALMDIEQTVIRNIETQQIRVTIKEALNQLIVAGNSLIFLPPREGGAKLYRLNSYVVQRDALGNVIQIVTADILSYATLSPELRTLVSSDGKQHNPDDKFTVYTHIYRGDGTFESYQEIDGKLIEGSEQQFPASKNPWIPLRMVKVDGESYGRSFVEEYLGDLQNLDAHTEALRNFAAITSHIVFMVNPAGMTRVNRLTQAKSGDYVSGRVEDVQAVQTNKVSDLSVTKAYIDGLEQRLNFIFLLNSAVQRNAERVTAEEIRYVAGELEDTLGGTYSILSQELQLPLVRRLMAQLEASGEIPPLPEGIVEPTITTGLEALGRGHDLNKLLMFKDFLMSVPGAAEMCHMDVVVNMVATSMGIVTKGVIKTPEERQQEQQQAMMTNLAQQAAGPITQGLVGNMAQQVEE